MVSLRYRAAMVVSLCSFRSRRRRGLIKVPKWWSRGDLGLPSQAKIFPHLVVLPQCSYFVVLSRFFILCRFSMNAELSASFSPVFSKIVVVSLRYCTAMISVLCRYQNACVRAPVCQYFIICFVFPSLRCNDKKCNLKTDKHIHLISFLSCYTLFETLLCV